MHSHWFNATVVMLWLATMSWLVTVKVLPPLLVGEPPNYGKVVEAQIDAPPVGWNVLFNNRAIGWALTETALQPSGLAEMHGRVHFDTLPLKEMIPGWLQPFSRLIKQPVGELPMDARSVLTIDPLGRLLHFDSTVQLAAFREMIRVRGTVEGRQLQFMIRMGKSSYTNEAFLPSNSLLSDALSPRAQLPGLRVGQTWTVPVYSPLWPAKKPLEIIHAKVEGTEPIFWNGEMVDAWLVVYRSDPGSGVGGISSPKGKLWVRRDGMVLRQQVMLFDSAITFLRLTDDEALKIVAEAGPQWWKLENEMSSKNYD